MSPATHLSVNQPIFYTEVASPLGTLLLRATTRGLNGLYLEEHRRGPTPQERAAWTRDDRLFAPVREQLGEYFAGARTAFDVALDQEGFGGSAFQHRVWAALLKIPYGQTITYGELARRIGQPAAVRAVGLANGRNPVSLIVPCHRVLGTGGKLTGYGGGTDRKRALLALESRGRDGELF